MKFFKAVILFLILSNFDSKAQGIEFFDGSFKDAYKLSKKLNKPMFVFASVDGCDVCAKVKQMLNDDLVVAYYSDHFVCFKMNADDIANNMRLTNWGLDHAPAYAYFKKKKKKEMIVSSGFKDSKKLLFDAQQAITTLSKADSGKKVN